jgi:hypothetical protein
MQRSANAGTELLPHSGEEHTIHPASRIASATAMAIFVWNTS